MTTKENNTTVVEAEVKETEVQLVEAVKEVTVTPEKVKEESNNIEAKVKETEAQPVEAVKEVTVTPEKVKEESNNIEAEVKETEAQPVEAVKEMPAIQEEIRAEINNVKAEISFKEDDIDNISEEILNELENEESVEIIGEANEFEEILADELKDEESLGENNLSVIENEKISKELEEMQKKNEEYLTTSELFEQNTSSEIRVIKEESHKKSQEKNSSGLKVINRIPPSNRQMYNSLADATLDFSELKQSETQKMLLANAKIEASYRERHNKIPHTIPSMTIEGIEYCKFNGRRQRMVVGTVGNYKVCIPEDLFFFKDEYRNDINRRLNSICNFTVMNIQKSPSGLNLVIADRTRAIERLISRFWQVAYLNNKHDYNTKKPLNLLHEGLVTKANVVEIISRVGVIVELGGLETLIPLNEISYERVNEHNITNYVTTGTSTYIKILKVTDREDINKIAFEASIKQVFPNFFKIAEESINVGGIYMGHIQSFFAQQNRYFVVLNNGITVLADPPNDKVGLIASGKKVSVYITKKYPEYKKDKLNFAGKIKFVYN